MPTKDLPRPKGVKKNARKIVFLIRFRTMTGKVSELKDKGVTRQLNAV